MRILTIAATPFFSDRGCHIRIYNEAKNLKELGADVLICTYHNGKDVDGLKTKRIGNVSWYTKTSPGFAWGKIWLDLKLIFLVAKQIKKFKPDVVHAHLFEGLGIGYFARLFTGKKTPLIFDLQDDLRKSFDDYNKKNKIAKKIFVKMSKWLMNKADNIMASSQRSVESAQKKFKNPEKVAVLKDGADFDFIRRPFESTIDVERELVAIKKWKEDANILIYTGGVGDSKGVDWLLREFGNVTENWKLLIFGKGEDREKYVKGYIFNDPSRKGFDLKYYPDSNYCNDKLWFCAESGYFSLAHYLNLADAGIEPKGDSTEGSGKMATYMAKGLPIVCFHNDFNYAKLKDKGFYIDSKKELNGVLRKLNDRGGEERVISYDLEKDSAFQEAKKLYNAAKILSGK